MSIIYIKYNAILQIKSIWMEGKCHKCKKVNRRIAKYVHTDLLVEKVEEPSWSLWNLHYLDIQCLLFFTYLQHILCTVHIWKSSPTESSEEKISRAYRSTSNRETHLLHELAYRQNAAQHYDCHNRQHYFSFSYQIYMHKHTDIMGISLLPKLQRQKSTQYHYKAKILCRTPISSLFLFVCGSTTRFTALFVCEKPKSKG